MPSIRTRFAPSPTGFLHIGGLRTALYCYLFAKKNNGTFILRIEDTDQEREVEGAKEMISATLREAGVIYDEGPDIGGPFAPYIQSERKALYAEHINKLIERDGAYLCFCTKERLAELKEYQQQNKIAFKYDGKCRTLTREEAEKRKTVGESYVVRQKIPQEGTTAFDDSVYGKVAVNNRDLDDTVLMKASGLPTYNFANVVDDHLMEITHVIRGSEFLSSTPKFNLLYQAFGWQPPRYVHLPPIMKDARQKLSKRHGDASFADFIAKGYLKEAIINSIALLGWNPRTNQEIFTLEELKERFDLEGLNKAPAIFDMHKLKWFNSEYIKRLTPEQFHALAKPYYEKVLRQPLAQEKISELIQTRTEALGEIPQMIDFLEKLAEYDTALYENKKMKTDAAAALNVLTRAHEVLEKLEIWEKEKIKETLFRLIAEMKMKNGQVLWPIRVALSGKEFTPGGAIEIAEILGKKETLERLERGRKKLKQ